MYEAYVVAAGGNGHFLHVPISLILSCQGGRETTVLYQKVKSRKTKKQRQKISQGKRGVGGGRKAQEK